jgi:hypothetical protein
MTRAALPFLLLAAAPAAGAVELEASYGRERLSGDRADWQSAGASATWTREDRARVDLGLLGLERYGRRDAQLSAAAASPAGAGWSLAADALASPSHEFVPALALGLLAARQLGGGLVAAAAARWSRFEVSAGSVDAGLGSLALERYGGSLARRRDRLRRHRRRRLERQRAGGPRPGSTASAAGWAWPRPPGGSSRSPRTGGSSRAGWWPPVSPASTRSARAGRWSGRRASSARATSTPGPEVGLGSGAGSDLLVRVALAAGLAALGLTAALGIQVLLMRWAKLRKERSRASFLDAWRPLLYEAAMGSPPPAPPLAARDEVSFLLLWNQLQDGLRGPPREGLNQLGRAVGA